MITKTSVTKGDKRAYLVCAGIALLASICYWQEERYQKLKRDYDTLVNEYIDKAQHELEFDICDKETIIWLCDELDKKERREIGDVHVKKIRDTMRKSMLDDYRYLRQMTM